MENILKTMIIIAIALILLYFILKYIVLPIMEWRTKKLKHKIALEKLEFLKTTYDVHLIARRGYYQAKQIEDPVLQAEEMAKYEYVHQRAIREFKDSDNLNYIEFLTPEEKSELDELMSRQIYGLI